MQVDGHPGYIRQFMRTAYSDIPVKLCLFTMNCDLNITGYNDLADVIVRWLRQPGT